MKRKLFDPIAVTGILFLLLFLALAFHIGSYSYQHRMELMSNSYNQRQKIFLAQNTRGSIYAADDSVLAKTETDANGTERRVYPYGELFAHAVGYADFGKSGIEAYANYYLVRSDISLREKMACEAGHKKNPGNDVYTTLQPRIQKAALDALGGERGAILLTEVKTGKILAMVSRPDFDPNTIAQTWKRMKEEDKNTQLLNRATIGLYPPGSTFKIVTALAYLREHDNQYQDYQYDCRGFFSIGKDTIRCFHGERHGHVNFMTSFALSCNSSFANIGVHLDRGGFQRTLHSLLFGQSLPYDLPCSNSYAKVNKDTTDADLMQVAIGQGTTLMTPLHLNMITSAIANGGTLWKPYFVTDVKNADGERIRSFAPENEGQLLSSTEAEIMRSLMADVVEEGTGRGLRGLSYTAAGKTGSAEYSSLTKDSHAWFTGFAPAQNPEVAITVILENAGTGGTVAVPVARQVLDAYFRR